MQVLRRSAYAEVRWKNGAGSSLEVASDGAPGQPFDWRVSIARVGQSGPFSDYTGHERTTALLEGAGFTLRAAGAATLRFDMPGDCHSYPGAVPYVCELHDGPCQDLNLIARQDIGASMTIMAAGAAGIDLQGADATRYVLALDGRMSVTAGQATGRLGAWDAAVLRAGESCRIAVEGTTERRLVALLSVPRKRLPANRD